MKKIFAYWFVLIILSTGIISINVQNSNYIHTQLNNLQHQNSIDATSESHSVKTSDNFWWHYDSNQVRSIDFSGNNVIRLIPDTSTFRASRYNQLTLQQLYSTSISLYNLLSNRQVDGYFLFFLCKMLIWSFSLQPLSILNRRCTQQFI